MKLYRSLEELPDSFCSGAVAIGNFDGVHLGHVRIVKRLVARARELAGPAVVFTFDPHPAVILRPEKAPQPLTSTARKVELLAQLEVDVVVAYPTNEAFLRLAPQAFFDEVVQSKLKARGLVEGYNFSFGRDRGGDVRGLAELCHNAGLSLDVVDPVLIDGEAVSSSRVRDLLREGQVRRARELLTQPYRMRGLVVHGAGRGMQLGYPTANLEGVDTLLPGGNLRGIGLVDGRLAAPSAWDRIRPDEGRSRSKSTWSTQGSLTIAI